MAYSIIQLTRFCSFFIKIVISLLLCIIARALLSPHYKLLTFRGQPLASHTMTLSHLTSNQHPLSILVSSKYADNTQAYLLDHASHRSSLLDEFAHISAQVLSNNLKLNANKSREMLLHFLHGFSTLLQQLAYLELSFLGLTLDGIFSFTKHISAVSQTCSRSLYAICAFESQGLNTLAIRLETKATCTMLSRLLCVASAWHGYSSASDLSSIERILSRTKRAPSFYVRRRKTTTDKKLLMRYTSTSFR